MMRAPWTSLASAALVSVVAALAPAVSAGAQELPPWPPTVSTGGDFEDFTCDDPNIVVASRPVCQEWRAKYEAYLARRRATEATRMPRPAPLEDQEPPPPMPRVNTSIGEIPCDRETVKTYPLCLEWRQKYLAWQSRVLARAQARQGGALPPLPPIVATGGDFEDFSCEDEEVASRPVCQEWRQRLAAYRARTRPAEAARPPPPAPPLAIAKAPRSATPGQPSPSDRFEEVVVGDATVRAFPEADAPVVTKLRRGDQVHVVERLPNGWVYLAKEGRPFGWLHFSALRQRLATAPPAPEPSAAALPARSESALRMAARCRPAIAAAAAGGTSGGQASGFRDSFESGACWGAFASIQEAFRQADDRGPLFRICLPPQSTRRQLVQVFLRYVDAHPELAHQAYFEVARAAFGEAFPCPG